MCQRRLEGAGLRTIGRELGRDPGTLSREVARNRRRSGGYWPEAAGRKLGPGAFGATAASATPNWALTFGSASSWVGRRNRSPAACGMKAVASWSATKPYTAMSIGHRARRGGFIAACGAARPGAGIGRPNGPGASRIPNRRSIHDRPEAANDRSAFGHWEGDSMNFRTQKRPMLTVTERQTRFALAAEHLDRTAEAASAAQIRLLAGLPPHASPMTRAASSPATSR
ncbi:transposase [Thiohalorhabdus sp.]|uniref:transposase n=1 Tax=Thiohalorhabdus sp. TaxID=3094134 RepID=UPI003FCDD845